MYENVLMVESMGPVATKHLISLIKRPLAGSSQNSGTQATCQVCTHLPSLASRQTRPLARATQATEEKKVLRQILGKFSRYAALWSSKNKAANCIWSAAETQSHKCICCGLTTRSPVCSQESRNCIQSSLDRELWVLKWVMFGSSWKENQSFGALL